MSKPFDAALKHLIALRPADWPAFLGVSARSVEVVDTDVSKVTAATDKVLLVRADAGDRIQHFEFQSGPDAALPRRCHCYNALLEDHHELPVDSVVVLLFAKANLRAINGGYEQRLPGETDQYLRFRYRVIRVWELPVESVLQAGIGLLPLAPISNVRQDQLPTVIAAMEQRLEAESNREMVGSLWASAGVLLGMQYDGAFIEQLLSRIREMEESSFYQAIVEKGLQKGRQEERPREARRILLRVGQERFGGPPAPDQQTALDVLDDATRLEDLVVRAGQVGSWAELLETSAAPAKPRRRKKS